MKRPLDCFTCAMVEAIPGLRIESNGADQLTHVVWVNVDESSSDRSPHFLVENPVEGRKGVTKSTKLALRNRTGKA
jgi:hypothetical protein